jgi:hypothetical protein
MNSIQPQMSPVRRALAILAFGLVSGTLLAACGGKGADTRPVGWNKLVPTSGGRIRLIYTSVANEQVQYFRVSPGHDAVVVTLFQNREDAVEPAEVHRCVSVKIGPHSGKRILDGAPDEYRDTRPRPALFGRLAERVQRGAIKCDLVPEG